MAVDQRDFPNLWPYVGFYFLTTTILSLAWTGYWYFVPSALENDSVVVAANAGIVFGSTATACAAFIRRHGRLFTRSEYWRMISYSTAASLLFTIISFVFFSAIWPAGNLSPSMWVLVITQVVFVFVLNAAGFSNRFGKIILKAHKKRQIQLDTEPFR
ncbi:ABZJ_00895 family protein [Mesorhizobium sp. J8]|uniref:ABZJ_00895 family protein n=1 Tax=Mesorhizobium sp. J8 TaxID=2777475 RepID=UPI0019167B23|nr:ABZJ_00895 family protein [Mesorhizobium sp. J8]BCM21347.1 hypothetical protein MJ8_51390 [Mesorhizobium sp. J8]